jgi:flagellar basal body rod protein FlgF
VGRRFHGGDARRGLPDAIGQVVPQVGTTSGIPLVLSTSTSGYTSSAEGSITTTLQHDSVIVEPVGSFVKQFPQGREPYVKPGNVLRIRVKGDGVTTHYSWLVFET